MAAQLLRQDEESETSPAPGRLPPPAVPSLHASGAIGAATPELAVNGTTASWYDPSTNTIHESPITKPKTPQGFNDPLAQVHQALQNGEARVLGTAHVDRVNTYKVQFADNGQFGSGSLVAYVDQSSYRPILLDDPQGDGGAVHLRVR